MRPRLLLDNDAEPFGKKTVKILLTRTTPLQPPTGTRSTMASMEMMSPISFRTFWRLMRAMAQFTFASTSLFLP